MNTSISISNQASNRYTPQEDAIILKKVSETPNNICWALEQAALELGRSAMAVDNRYYRKLKNGTKVAHTLSSNDGYVNNVKNTPRPQEENVDAITVILENFSRLTRRQAKAIFDIFNR